MQFTRQQLIFIGVAALIIIVFLAILFVGGRKPAEKINLTVWGIDDELAWNHAIFQFEKLYPNVRIEYSQLDEEVYEEELIDALAAGRGPDIFMINNRWTVKHADKITPMPEGKMSISTFSDLFPQVAEHDFLTADGQIYGLPLSIDTLALFYNRDIFDRKGVALPPRTWEEFLAVIPKLRSVSKSGYLVLAPAAIGGSMDNIANAPDILGLLMLQTGALTSEEYPSQTVRSEAGKNALEFYTRFTDTRDPAYSWDDTFPSAIQSFAQGEVAMVFGYAKDIEETRAQNPFLDFAIEPAPQASLNQALAIANYWGITVSVATQNPEAAWDFAVFAASDKDIVSSYLDNSGRPPALRTLIEEYLNDSRLGVFARQALTARGFFQGDDVAFQEIFDRAIRKAAEGSSIYEALQEIETELGRIERGE